MITHFCKAILQFTFASPTVLIFVLFRFQLKTFCREILKCTFLWNFKLFEVKSFSFLHVIFKLWNSFSFIFVIFNLVLA